MAKIAAGKKRCFCFFNRSFFEKDQLVNAQSPRYIYKRHA